MSRVPTLAALLCVAAFGLVGLYGCDPGEACLEDCRNDDDCESGLACFDGACHPEECADCPAGLTCYYSYDPDLMICDYEGCD